MGGSLTKPMIYQGDDPLFLLTPSIDEEQDDELFIPISDIDARFSEKLQFQEVLISSIISIDAYNETHSKEPDQGAVVLQSPQLVIDHVIEFEQDPDDPKGKRVIEAPQSTILLIGQSSNVAVLQSPQLVIDHVIEFEQDPDDPKGKRVIESPQSTILLIGQSSNEAVLQSPQLVIDHVIEFEQDPDDSKGKRVIEAPQSTILLIGQSSNEAVLQSPQLVIAQSDDQKGKGVIEAPQSTILLIGQSSNDPAKSKDAYCSICMESKDPVEFFVINPCSHEFCNSCVSNYIAAKVGENLTTIKCPEPGCGIGLLDYEMCRPILTPNVFDRWWSALCESLIETRFYCPYKDCSATMIHDEGGGEAIRESECPHCFRLFCAQCRVPWHAEMGCEEFQEIGEDEREREDLMLRNMARSCSWQRCPKCRFYVERTDGCRFMQCRCGYCFCYGCASKMTDHYCKKCKR